MELEASPSVRDWLLERVEAYTVRREKQRAVSSFALVADLDMAGARGSAIAALSLASHRSSSHYTAMVGDSAIVGCRDE